MADEKNYDDEEKMTEDNQDNVQFETSDDDDEGLLVEGQHSTYHVSSGDYEDSHHLSGMFRTWFLDYASYVNLERAIPHINDGLKPVQRRVLHAMRRLDDGRYNKVANIVGHTMQFHPHGDASIGDALVNLGQKNLLIDCQGNWGNILTGDGAAAPRYIEARLSKFALEAVFNPKTTEWKPSYDGRNKEPVSLPVKFPLLLAQGSEGIGMGLNSRILPHNFGELCDASIAVLRGEPFELFPDFPTGGMVDVSRYNDGERGGKLLIRARIEKIDNRTLKIIETPYGVTSGVLIDSIVKAYEKGKVNIKKIEDNTSKNVEIRIHLEPKTSSDKAIDALYAFTKCQVNYSPNCCVVDDNKPCFITVSEVLRRSTEITKSLLQSELQIERNELSEQLHFASLEKLFIEERIYKDREFEQAPSTEAALAHIDLRLTPFKPSFIRPVTTDDLQRLLEIKMARILKFNTDRASELIVRLNDQIKDVDFRLNHLVDYTIEWFEHLRQRYGHLYPRQTEIRNFETIEAAKVIEANEKLYFNKEEGFIGTALKRDENVELVCNCSDIDDIIIFYRDGKYKVIRVADKVYVGKNILHLAVFVKNDKRTIYNVVYRDGKDGDYFIKRFAVSGVTRDKEYDLTNGAPGSRVFYFSANANGEAEIIRVVLKQSSRRLKHMTYEKDFSDIAIKGRQSKGNLLSKYEIKSISKSQEGVSTLGGIDIYFDPDVARLNTDKRGDYLGNFDADDQILVVTHNGEFYTTSFDLNNHYDDDILLIEKFDPDKVWTAILYDAEQKYHYIKRFVFEHVSRRTSYLFVGGDSRVDLLSSTPYPRFKVVFGGDDSQRDDITIDAEEYIGVKSYKAKGKRLSNYEVGKVVEIEPARQPDVPETVVETNGDQTDPDDNTTGGGASATSVTTDAASADTQQLRAEDILAGIEIVSVQPDDDDPKPQTDLSGQTSLF